MSPLATYLREMSAVRSTGATVPETTYYPMIARLLSEVGAGLSPRVRCVLHPGSRGAGLPDGGLFTADQFRPGGEPAEGQVPARGVLEVKGTGREVDAVAQTDQVQRYLERYGQVLVTNYRDFLLLARAPGGEVHREAFRLAPSEAAFWAVAADRLRGRARGLGRRRGASVVGVRPARSRLGPAHADLPRPAPRCPLTRGYVWPDVSGGPVLGIKQPQIEVTMTPKGGANQEQITTPAVLGLLAVAAVVVFLPLVAFVAFSLPMTPAGQDWRPAAGAAVLVQCLWLVGVGRGVARHVRGRGAGRQRE